jgi:hypothetical protein
MLFLGREVDDGDRFDLESRGRRIQFIKESQYEEGQSRLTVSKVVMFNDETRTNVSIAHTA